MARALHKFYVRHGRMRIVVRVLATIREVDKEFGGGRARAPGTRCHAFFEAASAGAPIIGSIVVAAEGALLNDVPHEVTHAVMHRLGGVHSADDECLATAIGTLTHRILRRLARLGIEGGH